MWIYHQKTGQLYKDAQLLGTGYSGHGAGLNNPDLQSTAMVGPIPVGFYTIGTAYTEPYEHKMPPVMHLIPDSTNNMYGRSGFLIHGDSISAPGTASEGCIILNHTIRVIISKSTDRRLQVI